jgi:hypothetical protein
MKHDSQETPKRLNRGLVFRTVLGLSCLVMPTTVIAVAPNALTAKVDSTRRNQAPKLYIQDETYADQDYIKSEITFVNYVRDRTEADVQLTITCQTTANGGQEYCLTFQGLGSYHDINAVLKQTTAPDATGDEIRKALVDGIKRGLVAYVSRTSLRDNLSVEFKPPAAPTRVTDPWHNWVFSLSLYGFANGVQDCQYVNGYFNPDIKRVTDNEKFDLSGGLAATGRRFDLGDSILTALVRGYSADAFYARRLSNHFAIGVDLDYVTSDYSNIRLGFDAAPKFEYDLVPYSEYVRHKIFIQLAPTVLYRSYFDSTICDRLSETRLQNQLVLGVKMTRPWGTIDLSATGSNYLHDFRKNRLSLQASASLRIVAGLSLSVSGGYDFINDQLSLRKREPTEDELLLGLVETATGYSYWTSLSLTYTFGSIYTNIVNPIFQ